MKFQSLAASQEERTFKEDEATSTLPTNGKDLVTLIQEASIAQQSTALAPFYPHYSKYFDERLRPSGLNGTATKKDVIDLNKKFLAEHNASKLTPTTWTLSQLNFSMAVARVSSKIAAGISIFNPFLSTAKQASRPLTVPVIKPEDVSTVQANVNDLFQAMQETHTSLKPSSQVKILQKVISICGTGIDLAKPKMADTFYRNQQVASIIQNELAEANQAALAEIKAQCATMKKQAAKGSNGREKGTYPPKGKAETSKPNSNGKGKNNQTKPSRTGGQAANFANPLGLSQEKRTAVFKTARDINKPSAPHYMPTRCHSFNVAGPSGCTRDSCPKDDAHSCFHCGSKDHPLATCESAKNHYKWPP